jgi:murein DD-endopeptidase MepM/ murein hydrolase activator NlpD
VSVTENPVDNKPGILGESRAAGIELERDDGVHFALGHIQKPKVRAGDRVKAGDIIAKIGNNGYARSPHLHIGAWKAKTALQIRWDLSKMGLPSEYRSQGKR